MSRARERLERRVGPRLVVAVSRITLPARTAAALRRRRGLPGEVELFFAFDDPCSAVALIELSERLTGRSVELRLRPVLRRGIPGDPAVEDKRRYAIEDARRLARRSGLELARSQPLAAEEIGYLAEWVAASPPQPALERFCVAAMRALWFSGEGPVERAALESLWREQLASAPPVGGAESVSANERLMSRRGPYDVPAAWVHGRWYFAHDRLGQIGEWLDELGWRAA